MAKKNSIREGAKRNSPEVKKKVKEQIFTLTGREFCKGCGYPVAQNGEYCAECMCEDDCGY